MKIKHEIIDWLNSGPSWISYRVKIDLEDKPPKEVKDLKKHVMEDPRIVSIIEELKDWPGPVLKSHKNANLLIHKLSFLAELGLTKDNPEIKNIIDIIFKYQSNEGPFNVLINIPANFGGTGEDLHTWILSDAPVIVSALFKIALTC
jgi:hypothetical protein